jgi:Insertion element 4 transposase N-terminal/Transposase DDE domain
MMAGMARGGVAGSALTDWISLGVLASWVPRDAVDDAVAVTGKGARRAGGRLPPHVMVYFVMALALFADEDYEEVITRLAAVLAGWGCWEDGWEVPTSGGICQARQRLGPEPLAELFGQVAGPVADLETAGAFLGRWRLMSVDGMEWDVPDSKANRAFFGSKASGAGPAVFPGARVVTVSECGSHAPVAAAVGPSAGGKGSGEQALARKLLPDLEEDWLLLADRNFYSWKDWGIAAGTGAALLWRVKSSLGLPVLEVLPDGSWRSVLIRPGIDPRGAARAALLAAAGRGEDLDPGKARYVRVIEYQVPDRAGNGKGDRVILVTTIAGWQDAPAAQLAQAYHQRWEHETGNGQLKTHLRGPHRVLRSQSPAMAEQEIWGYLLTHYAISALTCTAATNAGIDPDRVKFKRTVRVIRRQAGDPAFSP